MKTQEKSRAQKQNGDAGKKTEETEADSNLLTITRKKTMLMNVYVHRSSICKSTSIMQDILNSVFTQGLSHKPCATDGVHLNSTSSLSRRAYSINIPHLKYTSVTVCVIVFASKVCVLYTRGVGNVKCMREVVYSIRPHECC